MFGAVFIFALIIYGIVQVAKNTKDDFEGRRLYKDEKSNTYLAYDGSRRDLDTGKQRFIYHQNGDRYMVGEDIETVNLSQKEREEKYEKVKLNHAPDQTVVFYEKEPLKATKRGVRYKDLKTGDIYVVREDKNANSFYVTFDNRVVRFADNERKYRKEFGVYDEEEERELVTAFQEAINNAPKDTLWKDPTLIYHKKGRRL